MMLALLLLPLLKPRRKVHTLRKIWKMALLRDEPAGLDTKLSYPKVFQEAVGVTEAPTKPDRLINRMH